jgi:hypothetical protein
MSDPIVKDSSIWQDPFSFQKMNSTDSKLKIGIVRTSQFNKDRGDITYIVEVQDAGDKLFIQCRHLRKHGGVYNFEDFTLQDYKFDQKYDPIPAFDTKAGDAVLVAYLNGDSREGVILGGLTHSARASTLKPEDGPQYLSQFNGIETSINKDGEYTVTFKAQPKNISKLKDSPNGKKIVAPEWDKEVGTSYFKFDKEGSYTVADNATSDPQSLKIDKKNGKIIITSGKIVLTMEKKKELTTLVCKELNIAAKDKMSTKTKEWLTDASATATIKSPKIAFGTDNIELLDQIIKAIEAIGKVTPISPVGPCAPMQSAPQWPQVDAIKSKINTIKGTVK